jgi:hypothetical protein
VADYGNHRVQRYDMVSRTWTIFGQYGNAAPSGSNTWFNNPNGLCVDAADNLYVADQNNDRIQRRDAITGQWTVLGNGRGNGVGQFIGPSDVVADSQGALYVADLYNYRVQRLDGGTNNTWQVIINPGTNPGLVYFPRGMLIDETNTLYVSDSGPGPGGHSRIQTFLTNMQHLAVLGTHDAANGGLLQPGGMAKYSNTLYIADTDNNRVTTFDLSSSAWTPLTLATNLLDRPEDVAIQLRWLFIVDTGNNRIMQLVVDHGPSTVWPASETDAGGGNVLRTLAWDAMAGWRYDLEYTTNLVSWLPIAGMTNMPGTNAVMTGQDTAPASSPRTYRVNAY